MRKGKSKFGGTGLSAFNLFGISFAAAVVAVLLIAGLSIVGAGSAQAEGADDWSHAAFSKSVKSAASTKSAAIGSITGTSQSSRSSAGKAKSTKLASLGSGIPASKPSKPVTGGGVRWVASSGCLNGTLRSAVASIASRFGAVTVSSTCRSAGHNRRVGGAPKSHHLTGDAVDLRVHGNWGGAFAALRSMGLGGVKHYGGGLFHADTGPRRSW